MKKNKIIAKSRENQDFNSFFKISFVFLILLILNMFLISVLINIPGVVSAEEEELNWDEIDDLDYFFSDINHVKLNRIDSFREELHSGLGNVAKIKLNEILEKAATSDTGNIRKINSFWYAVWYSKLVINGETKSPVTQKEIYNFWTSLNEDNKEKFLKSLKELDENNRFVEIYGPAFFASIARNLKEDNEIRDFLNFLEDVGLSEEDKKELYKGIAENWLDSESLLFLDEAAKSKLIFSLNNEDFLKDENGKNARNLLLESILREKLRKLGKGSFLYGFKKDKNSGGDSEGYKSLEGFSAKFGDLKLGYEEEGFYVDWSEDGKDKENRFSLEPNRFTTSYGFEEGENEKKGNLVLGLKTADKSRNVVIQENVKGEIDSSGNYVYKNIKANVVMGSNGNLRIVNIPEKGVMMNLDNKKATVWNKWGSRPAVNTPGTTDTRVLVNGVFYGVEKGKKSATLGINLNGGVIIGESISLLKPNKEYLTKLDSYLGKEKSENYGDGEGDLANIERKDPRSFGLKNIPVEKTVGGGGDIIFSKDGNSVELDNIQGVKVINMNSGNKVSFNAGSKGYVFYGVKKIGVKLDGESGDNGASSSAEGSQQVGGDFASDGSSSGSTPQMQIPSLFVGENQINIHSNTRKVGANNFGVRTVVEQGNIGNVIGAVIGKKTVVQGSGGCGPGGCQPPGGGGSGSGGIVDNGNQGVDITPGTGPNAPLPPSGPSGGSGSSSSSNSLPPSAPGAPGSGEEESKLEGATLNKYLEDFIPEKVLALLKSHDLEKKYPNAFERNEIYILFSSDKCPNCPPNPEGYYSGGVSGHISSPTIIIKDSWKEGYSPGFDGRRPIKKTPTIIKITFK